MSIVNPPRLVGLFVLLALIVLAPLFFPSGYYFRIGALIFINSIAVMGLVILMGFAGQISLGHAGFVGIGAYSAALAPLHLGIPPVGAIFLGCLLSGGIAWIIGRPILSLKGYYLAVATLGFGILVALVITNESGWTGGPDGIAVEALGLRSWLRSLGLNLKTSVIWYWFSALVMWLAGLLAINLYDSASGRALRALHDSEVAAQSLGINVANYKLSAFVVSSVYASISGSLLAQFNRFVTPEIAGFLHSIELLTMAVLGGISSVLGAVTGTSVLITLPQFLAGFHEYEPLLLGLIMMLVVIFMKQGLLPSLLAFFRVRPA